jgi:hypothetical protein
MARGGGGGGGGGGHGGGHGGGGPPENMDAYIKRSMVEDPWQRLAQMRALPPTPQQHGGMHAHAPPLPPQHWLPPPPPLQQQQQAQVQPQANSPGGASEGAADAQR